MENKSYKSKLFACVGVVTEYPTLEDVEKADEVNRVLYKTLVVPLFARALEFEPRSDIHFSQLGKLVKAVNKVCKVYDEKSMQMEVSRMIALYTQRTSEVETLIIKRDCKKAYKIICNHEYYKELRDAIMQEFSNDKTK